MTSNNNGKVKIDFYFSDLFGDEFRASNSFEIFPNEDNDEYDALFDAFYKFLIQIGYPLSKGCLFKEDMTETEREVLKEMLNELREKNLKEDEDNDR